MKRFAQVLILVAALAEVSVAFSQVAGNLPETSPSGIEYQSVEVALKAVLEKPGVEIRTENGWTIAIDLATRTIWSFAPKGHPAYPTVVKRSVVPAEKGSVVEMRVLCESDKVSCDSVVLQFQQLNERAFGGAK
jgi:hypothetical protein